MKFASLIAAPLMLCALSGVAQAQQFQTDADIDTPSGDSNRYDGSDPEFGEANDGGRDAFDGYGELSNLRGLTLQRRSEVFVDRNLYRFVDMFTNNTSARIRTTISFFGDLGSDSDTLELLSEDGLVVSCEDETDVLCVGGGDPVIAHVFSNINFGLASIGGGDADSYNALFRLDLAPGQTASLLNFAFLASEESGTSTADIDLAIARGRDLQANPFVDGLPLALRGTIVNFDVPLTGPVPEPATWAMMIAGSGLVGGAARRSRRRARVFA